MSYKETNLDYFALLSDLHSTTLRVDIITSVACCLIKTNQYCPNARLKSTFRTSLIFFSRGTAQPASPETEPPTETNPQPSHWVTRGGASRERRFRPDRRCHHLSTAPTTPPPPSYLSSCLATWDAEVSVLTPEAFSRLILLEVWYF